MVYIVPLQFSVLAREEIVETRRPQSGIIRGRTDSLKTRYPRSRIIRRPRSPTIDWFINKTLEDELKLIEPTSIVEKIEPLINETYSGVKNIDPDIFKFIVARSSIDVHMPSIYINDNIIAFLSDDPGLLILLTNDMNNVDKICEIIDKRANSLSNITSDLGVVYEGCMHGEDYVQYILSSKAEIIEKGDFKNEFEKSVYEDIKINITNALFNNFTLDFKESSEVYEYDIVTCIGQNRIFQISCKDYSIAKEDAKEDNTNLRNKVIFQPKDKADLISAKCYVVLKGFTKKLLTQFKAYGEPRDVTILDESEYLEEINDTLMGTILRRILR